MSHSTFHKSSAFTLVLPVWRQADGHPIACLEKIKVLNDNLEELRQLAQDALEDAILLDVPEAQIRTALYHLVDQLINPYAKNT